MATIDNTGRPGYMYDEDTDTWYAISGKVSTSANYIWSGANTFNNNVFVNGTLNATLRFNSFLNPAARASAITAPAVGLLTFIQQDAGGNTINRFEFWNGTAWTAYADPATTVTLAGTQTLTNKTLTAPSISNAVTTGSINAQTGTSYTIQLSDRDRIVELNNASAITLTVPTDAAVNFPVGSNVSLLQTGAGQVTVGGAGVTINSNPGLKLSGQWAAATLIKRAANTWVLIGNTAS